MLAPQLLADLQRYGQEQVLDRWDTLPEAEQRSLSAQLADLDLELLARLFRSSTAADDWQTLAARAKPPSAIRLDGQGLSIGREQARVAGQVALRAGTVGVILVAGGQGTRLGFDRPKGMYPVGPVTCASLFQYLLEGVRAVARRYGTRVPLGIMTSPATHGDTLTYLQEHAWFGLSADDVTLFCQGTMPALDAATGKLLMESPSSLALSPDGHGGLLSAMARAGLIDRWQESGIQQAFYCQVDNPLVTIADPEFIGFHLLSAADVSTQVVAKHSPDDRLGNVVTIDDRAQIIEYSDLPADAGLRRAPDGSLELWAGSIAVHVFDMALLARSAVESSVLPFHRALKRVPYVDASGQRIEPAEPNAVKFERFIFDLLPVARRAIVVEVARQDAFGPLKNAPGSGSDSPEMVREMLVDRARRWLRSAGAQIADDAVVEIRPLFALDADELRERISHGTMVGSGTCLG